MTIRGNLSVGVQELGATDADVSVHNNANRTAVTGFSVFNNSGINAAFEVFESPDGTSASGEIVASYILADQESCDVIECIGQGYSAGAQLVVVVTTATISAGELNAKLTFTVYTGAS